MKMRRAPSCAWGQLPSHSLPGMKIVCTFKWLLHYSKSFQSEPAHGTRELREALNVCLKFFPLCKAASVDFASFPKSLLLVEHTSAMQALSERTRSQVRIGTNNAKNANKLQNQKMDDNDTSTPQSIGIWQSKIERDLQSLRLGLVSVVLSSCTTNDWFFMISRDFLRSHKFRVGLAAWRKTTVVLLILSRFFILLHFFFFFLRSSEGCSNIYPSTPSSARSHAEAVSKN